MRIWGQELQAPATTIPGLTQKIVSYELDANGNRTRLTWPDSYFVGYCYDNLNRMAGAFQNSQDTSCNSNTLATYAYDALSRRSSVLYGNNASITYSNYSDAGDLGTLQHDMAQNDNDPLYTFGYGDNRLEDVRH